jgi:two-component system sensor histidine kinase CpxA
MIRLLLKIFLAYWVAAGIVIAISDYEPHRHIHNPELTDALDSALAMDGRSLVDAYEAGRCLEFQKLHTTARDGLYLAMPDGKTVCGSPGISDISKLIVSTVAHKKRMTANYALFQLIATPVVSPSGTKYVLLLKNSYSSALQIYGMLPGYTTFAISCVVTFFLGVLLALPIRRLRRAAERIAMGALDTRVKWPGKPVRGPEFRGGDDISYLIRDFNLMAERLESLAKAQRLLLRDVSHELRSPLTRLGVGLGLARAESPVEMRKHLDRIDIEAARLNSLIGQILSLSQIDTLRSADLSRVLSLSELVVDLLPDVQYEAMQKNCSITTKVGAGCYVRGDSELLSAAVENIVRNSIKYISRSGEIEIETATEARFGERFSTLRVSDNGPGIPAEEMEFVLEPFYRADRSRHWQQEGSGIGLAIADRTARLHHGTIDVRNKPNGGLIVEISLPSVDFTGDDSQGV